MKSDEINRILEVMSYRSGGKIVTTQALKMRGRKPDWVVMDEWAEVGSLVSLMREIDAKVDGLPVSEEEIHEDIRVAKAEKRRLQREQKKEKEQEERELRAIPGFGMFG